MVTSVCSNEVEAARYELEHMVQRAKEVCSQLEALQGGSLCTDIMFRGTNP